VLFWVLSVSLPVVLLLLTAWLKPLSLRRCWLFSRSSNRLKPPREVCKDVTVTRRAAVKDQHQIAGSVIGAVAGGLLGNQIGGGNGKKIATVAGAVGGGYAGNKVQEGMQNRDTYTTTQTRCNTVNDISDKVVGYDVRYNLDGKEGGADGS
jgi:uncharacterized protein YcfJ